MKNYYVQMATGIFLGLLMPALGTWLMLSLRPELAGIQEYSHDVVKSVNVRIITLGMIINAALFFVFIRFKREGISQGILVISVAELVAVFIYRFLL